MQVGLTVSCYWNRNPQLSIRRELTIAIKLPHGSQNYTLVVILLDLFELRLKSPFGLALGAPAEPSLAAPGSEAQVSALTLPSPLVSKHPGSLPALLTEAGSNKYKNQTGKFIVHGI